MPNEETRKVEEALAGSAVHDVWEGIYRTEDNERAWETMFDRLAQLVPPGRVLDVGCGIGQHSVRMTRRKFDAVASDFSPSRVEAARANIANQGLAIPVRQEDVTRLSFDAASFDAVLSWGVLMHVPEVERAMAEICRVTKPGGYIIVYENNARSLFSWFLSAGVAAKRLLGRAGTQRVVRSPLGIESWVRHEDGNEYVIRRLHVGAFVKAFSRHGARLTHRLPGQFSEAYRFVSPGPVQKAVHRLNEAWFRSGITALAMGNIFIFRRA